MKSFQIFRFFRPTQGGKSPKPGRKPSIQCVFVLFPIITLGRFNTTINLILVVIPNGNSVSIPYLTGNTPVPQIFYPMKISFGKIIRYNFYFFILQWFINVNKPIKERGDKTLKDLMREPIEKGEIKIIPEHFEKVYYHWIENL